MKLNVTLSHNEDLHCTVGFVFYHLLRRPVKVDFFLKMLSINTGTFRKSAVS